MIEPPLIAAATGRHMKAHGYDLIGRNTTHKPGSAHIWRYFLDTLGE
jgi:hypothetical protein